MQDESPKPRRGVQSVEVGAALLRALAAADEPQSLANLSRASGMPSGKAHRYLISYVQSGLVVQDPLTSFYDLGPLAQILGLASLRRNDTMRVAIRQLSGLRDDLNETVLMFIWGPDEPTVAAAHESHQPVAIHVRVRTTFPVLSTASGRLFAAYGEANIAVQARVSNELRDSKGSEQAGRIRTHSALASVVADVRERGLARLEDFIPGISVISAPMFGHDGVLAAAVSVVGRSGSINLEWSGRPAVALRTFTEPYGAFKPVE